MAVKQIGSYQVQYASNTFVPRIWLRDTANVSIGQLIFMPDGKALPADNATNLYYHLSDFAHVIDLLRNEKPVYWDFVGSGGGNENAIRTSVEPQGEGETA
jgi:hypothetical protein